jgi:hypothetical protein
LLITFGSILIVANSYLQIQRITIMSQIEKQQNTFQNSTEPLEPEPCFCEKKTCAIGIASISIGIGGFILASLL